MVKVSPKIIPALFAWGIFIGVVLQVPYPDNLAQANLQQFSFFFAPLFLAIVFTLNVFFKNIFISLSISLGMILLLILKALDSLNIVTGLLILISVGLFLSYFKKTKRRIGDIQGIRGIKKIRGNKLNRV